MKKNEFKVNGTVYSADDIGWEYSLQEGDNAGRSDDGTMYHDVIGMIKKVYFDFKDFRDETKTAELINLLEETDCNLTYYDLKAKDFITKKMYVAGDKITAKLVDGVFYVEPFQIRFITNGVE